MFWKKNNVCPAGIEKFYIAADKSIYPCNRLTDKPYESYEKMREEFEKLPETYCRQCAKACGVYKQ